MKYFLVTAEKRYILVSKDLQEAEELLKKEQINHDEILELTADTFAKPGFIMVEK